MSFQKHNIITLFFLKLVLEYISFSITKSYYIEKVEKLSVVWIWAQLNFTEAI